MTATIYQTLEIQSRLDELATLLNHDEVAGGAVQVIEDRMEELQAEIDKLRQPKDVEPRPLKGMVDSILDGQQSHMPVRSNTDGMRVYFEASGKDYFIPAEVEQMIDSLDQPAFYDLKELDADRWGVLVVTASASYRIHAAIKEGL